jgi:hypothetical protein
LIVLNFDPLRKFIPTLNKNTMSNKHTATKNEKSNGSSGKNAHGSAHQKPATNEQAAKNQRDSLTNANDENETQNTLKDNSTSLDSKDASKEVSKNHSSKK